MDNDSMAAERGFAAMDEKKQRAIASKGGKAAHQKGTAHEFTSAEARIAGRKGGEAISEDRAHMAEIGAEGGRSRAGRSRAKSRSSMPRSGPARGAKKSSARSASRQRGTGSQSKSGRPMHKASR